MIAWQAVTQAVVTFCNTLPADASVVVGLSGGVDSVVLTHALTQQISKNNSLIQLKIVHVNHGLQEQADDWQGFSKKLAESLSVPFESYQISIGAKNRQGLESVARDKRYQALFESCDEGGHLLTAHHQRDQVETILLNLFRGTGLKGLLGMPGNKLVTDKKINHARPLLNVPVEAIKAYAKHFNLNWVEDPSNMDISFSRNEIRHEIIPKLLKSAQGGKVLEANITRMASNLAEEWTLLNDLAEMDLKNCVFTPLSLDLSAVFEMSWTRQRNVIRYWNERYAQFSIRFTSELFQWVKESLLNNNPNAHPSKMGKNFEINIEKNKLFLLAIFDEEFRVNLTAFEPIKFGFDEPVIFESLKKYQSNSLKIRSLNEQEFADKKLKKWFKEQKIVFWNRKRWPVVCDENNVLEIIGYNTSPF